MHQLGFRGFFSSLLFINYLSSEVETYTSHLTRTNFKNSSLTHAVSVAQGVS